MALVLSTDTPEAVYPNAYHRVVKMANDADSRVCVLAVWSYANAASRQAKKKLIRAIREFRIEGADYDSTFSAAALDALGKSPYAAAYLYLLTTSDFAGATSV